MQLNIWIIFFGPLTFSTFQYSQHTIFSGLHKAQQKDRQSSSRRTKKKGVCKDAAQISLLLARSWSRHCNLRWRPQVEKRWISHVSNVVNVEVRKFFNFKDYALNWRFYCEKEIKIPVEIFMVLDILLLKRVEVTLK